MDFIRAKVSRDLKAGKYGGRVVTRFPPEPNGFLHIGHAKAICLNFGIAAEHPVGRCHLRLDDTNPDSEKTEYVGAMKRDIRWLGFDWGDHLYYASDYFEKLYRYAHVLIDKGLAYVDSSPEHDIRRRRGTVTQPGTDSADRGRSVAENRELFRRMRRGEFPDGSHVLRAKIDMAHPNMVMRDPLLYRIRHSDHYRTGTRWPIYPMYDFAHCISDSIEEVTHSLCTLEFENNRELYDWILNQIDAPAPRPEQTEFAPLVLDHVITSKRKLRLLVDGGHVHGWDDPRMPTLAGLRRRGVTPTAIRALCHMVGVARAHSRVDLQKLDFAVRDDLNHSAPRAFCVMDPIKVVLSNYPPEAGEVFEAPVFPGASTVHETRKLPFGRELFIDRADFEENPPPGFHRLIPGGKVRLKYAYVIRCDDVIKDDRGRPVQLRCSVDLATGGGVPAAGPRVRGTIHWLSVQHAVPAEIRLYDPLFSRRCPSGGDVAADLNPNSEVIFTDSLVEPGVKRTEPATHYQFERHGYFFSDPQDSRRGHLVFNRTVSLRARWSERGKAHMPAKSGKGASEPGGRDARQRGALASSPVDSLRSESHKQAFEELTGLGVGDAAAASIARSPEALTVFRSAYVVYPDGAGSIAAWLANECARQVNRDEDRRLDRLAPAALADLARAVDMGDLSHRQGRSVLAHLLQQGGAFGQARSRVDLAQVVDERTLANMVAREIQQHPGRAAAYRNGQTGLLQFFVGRVMRASKGRADPRLVSGIAKSQLGDDS